MKALIDNERVSKDLANDVKRGPGGIREAEFVVQSHQLTHGGRIPAIQTINFQTSAAVLAKEQCAPQSVVSTLTSAYRHLRQVEHGIQALRDEQTHSIPDASMPKKTFGIYWATRHGVNSAMRLTPTALRLLRI